MKLDLRKTKAETVMDNMDEDIFMEEKTSLFSKIKIDPRDLVGFLFRVAFCFVGVLVLKYVEKQNLEQLQADKALVSGELSELQEQQKEIQNQVNAFGHMKERSKEFNNKLNIMQNIANNRLSAINGLDHIQNVIPEEVWLKKVAFNNRKFEITGSSTTNRQIQNFVKELEEDSPFASVNLDRVEEDRNAKRLKRRNFTVTSTLN